MEEKRKEAKEMLEADDERKARARKKEQSWHLLRQSMKFLEEDTGGWRKRKILEIERIKRRRRRTD